MRPTSCCASPLLFLQNVYVLVRAQLVGAVLGALLQAWLSPDNAVGKDGPGCFAPSSDSLTPFSLWAWETLLTFLFLAVSYAAIFVVPGHGDASPLAAGLALFAALSTGASFVLLWWAALLLVCRRGTKWFTCARACVGVRVPLQEASSRAARRSTRRATSPGRSSSTAPGAGASCECLLTCVCRWGTAARDPAGTEAPLPVSPYHVPRRYIAGQLTAALLAAAWAVMCFGKGDFYRRECGTARALQRLSR